jgi:hypothetical protein
MQLLSTAEGFGKVAGRTGSEHVRRQAFFTQHFARRTPVEISEQRQRQCRVAGVQRALRLREQLERLGQRE